MKNYGAIVTNFTTSPSEEGKKEEQKAIIILHEDKRMRSSSLRSSVGSRYLLLASSVLLLFVISYTVFNQHVNSFRSGNSISTSTSQDDINCNNTQKEHVTIHPLSFDYIVVGAGPSGIVTAVNLARRLKEKSPQIENNDTKNGFANVLLIESGSLSQSSVLRALQDKEKGGVQDPLPPPLHDPYFNERVFPNSSLDLNKFDVPYFWNDLSKKEATKGLNHTNNSFYSLHHWPIDQTFLGRAVGGSGVHNAMINVRALPSDFDRWNVTNWTREIMMPYFRTMESYDNNNNEVPFWTKKEKNQSSRGYDGPIKVQQAGSIKMKLDPVANLFVSSALSAGLPLASMGFNDEDERLRRGVGLYEFNIRNGLRDSVASALLSEDRDGYEIPDNLIVWTSSTVHKVLFDDTTSTTTTSSTKKPRAVGLLYDSGNTNAMHQVMLKNYLNSSTNHTPEIILAAGAILTPQILSNSGIRDGGSISNLSGVGQNLQDHQVIAVGYQESDQLDKDVNRSISIDAEMKGQYLNALKYWNKHPSETNENVHASNDLGILGTASFAAGAFLSSPWSVDGNPDIQLTVFPTTEEPHSYDELLKSGKYSELKKNVLITVALLRPEGRRKIDMAPYDGLSGLTLPSLYPKDNALYLTDLDIERLSWGIKQVRQIMSRSPLANETEGEVFPGNQIDSDKDLREFVINESMTNSHWCGSTKMGKSSDGGSVVDETLKVHGVDSLRIVDAGVMPFIPNGNTHSTTCAIALRGVDLILGDS